MTKPSLSTLLTILVLIFFFNSGLYAQTSSRSSRGYRTSYSAGLAAAQKWEYGRARPIFEELSKKPGPHRIESKKWIRRIDRIIANCQTYKAKTGQSWESIALETFNDVSYAGKLAAFNDRSIVDRLLTGQSVLIPTAHLEAVLAWQAYDNADEASLADLAQGIAHMRHALTIDPEYPELRDRLNYADEVYMGRTAFIKADSLDNVADSLAIALEFTEAIKNLRRAQNLNNSPERWTKIKRLIRNRRDHLPVWFEQGNEAFRAGRLEEALDYWNKVYEVDQRFRDVRERIENAKTMIKVFEKDPDSDE